MKTLKKLFENNIKWSEEIKKNNPNFFPSLAKGQSPKFMWIGCSDSRVVAEKVVGLQPGEMFVHRNVANIISSVDSNCLAAVQFAIEGLNIEHIIICGHYDCGGVRAAEADEPDNHSIGLVYGWLSPIKSIVQSNKEYLSQFNGERKIKALCELNVLEQVKNLKNSYVIKDVIKQGRNIKIYGLIYDVSNGLLKQAEIFDS